MAGTILIVEDEADLVPALEFAFRRAGFRTVTVASGEQALDMIPDAGVDIVLLDLMLPGLSGTEVCQRLRADDRTRQLPVIMMTASVEVVDVRSGFAAGVDDYVVKPFHMKELVRRVRMTLRRRPPSAPRLATSPA